MRTLIEVIDHARGHNHSSPKRQLKYTDSGFTQHFLPESLRKPNKKRIFLPIEWESKEKESSYFVKYMTLYLYCTRPLYFEEERINSAFFMVVNEQALSLIINLCNPVMCSFNGGYHYRYCQ